MNIAANHRHEVGDVLIFETGAYSDYTFTGPFRVLKAFVRYEAVYAFRAAWKPTIDQDDEPDADAFIGWMMREGFIEEIPHSSWHIGRNGGFHP